MNIIGYEAHCTKCGETFNPNDENDLIHAQREDGEECGGQGVMIGAWGRPDFDLIVSGRHMEYCPSMPVGGPFETIWQPDYAEESDDWEALWVERTGLPVERIPEDADLAWESIVRFRGEREQLLFAIAELVGEIGGTPSGDHDTFDYWPSGVLFAMALAEAAGEQWSKLVYNVAAHTVWCIDKMKHQPEIAEELRDRLGIEAPQQ